MFNITMLPAEYGDCLWLEYGPDGKSPKRMLIDAGTPKVFSRLAKKIRALPANERVFELFVITHIDEDHIGGAMRLLEELVDLGVTFRDVWFNGFRHLQKVQDLLGPVQGERVTRALANGQLPWNRAFKGKPVMVPAKGALPTRTIGGMKITLLSPRKKELLRLFPIWEEMVKEEGIVEGVPAKKKPAEGGDILGLDVDELAKVPFECDSAEANGSSIAFLAEYDGVRCLFGADAYPTVLLESLERMQPGSAVPLDAIKLPHHGSRANLHLDLLRKVRCSRFLISTNGKRFKHPNPEAIARVLKSGKNRRLFFNYRSVQTEDWDSDSLRDKYRYRTSYPDDAISGIVVKLS